MHSIPAWYQEAVISDYLRFWTLNMISRVLGHYCNIYFISILEIYLMWSQTSLISSSSEIRLSEILVLKHDLLGHYCNIRNISNICAPERDRLTKPDTYSYFFKTCLIWSSSDIRLPEISDFKHDVKWK